MNIDSDHIFKKAMSNPIYNITPFTLLDYPNKAACILWFVGCNMRCLYCYNPDIVFGKGNISIQFAEAFLRSRQGLLQAVVFSGGECTSHHTLIDLIKTAKKLGYLVKIDTNGSHPEVLSYLIQKKLVDYIALDFKGMDDNFEHITMSTLFEKFKISLELMVLSNLTFEVRTTIHTALTSKDQLQKMIRFLEDHNYSGTYYLQKTLNNVETLAPLPDSPYSTNYFENLTARFPIVLR